MGMDDSRQPAQHSSAVDTGKAPLPAQATGMLCFQGANAVNFTIALGVPMILLARRLGANEVQQGLLLSLPPFLVALQLPAAAFARRLGYRRLMLAGWSARSLLLLFVAPLPLLTGHLPSIVLIWVFMGLQLAFNALRGFASGAWLPWMARLIPLEVRGRYLGLESTIINVMVFVTMIGAGLFLGSNAPAWRYTVLFLAACAAGLISVRALAGVPDQAAPDAARGNGSSRAAWREGWLVIRAHRDLRATTAFVALYNFAVSAAPGFIVLFMRTELGFGDRAVLLVSATATLGSLLAARATGHLTDRFGSRPILRLAGLGQALILLGWTVLAWRPQWGGVTVVTLAQSLLGVCGTAYAISQLRLILATCPAARLTSALAANQVIISFAGGASPVLAGLAMRSLRTLPGINPYALLFGVALALLLAAHLLLSAVREARSTPATVVLVRTFWHWPLRVLASMRF